jgi:hypothetical protein
MRRAAAPRSSKGIRRARIRCYFLESGLAGPRGGQKSAARTVTCAWPCIMATVQCRQLATTDSERCHSQGASRLFRAFGEVCRGLEAQAVKSHQSVHAALALIQTAFFSRLVGAMYMGIKFSQTQASIWMIESGQVARLKDRLSNKNALHVWVSLSLAGLIPRPAS